MATFIWPTDTKRVTSKFRSASRPNHHGIDIAEAGYHPIYAAAAGEVSRSYSSPSYGECIMIVHSVGGQTWETVYAHMRVESRRVNVGDRVKQGQTIGVMGNTGQSSGQHLHFELHRGRWNSSKSNGVDPLNYLSDDTGNWRIPTETPSDEKYYRIKTGLFTNLSSFENALSNFKTKYPYIINMAPDRPVLVQENEWRTRFYTGRMQGANNARIYKKALEERFSWNFHIVDAAHEYENIVVKSGGNSEENYYRVMTGFFNNLKSYNNAREVFKSNYSAVIYEAADDSNFHEDGDLKLRFYTGRVKGRAAAERLKRSLEQKFSWNFHIIDSIVTAE